MQLYLSLSITVRIDVGALIERGIIWWYRWIRESRGSCYPAVSSARVATSEGLVAPGRIFGTDRK